MVAVVAYVLTGCSDDLFNGDYSQHDSNRIQLSGDIDQLAVTRVNDNGFCNGDVMGVYIVDYEGNNPGTLKVSGNRGDNVRHTFDEPNYKWSSAYDLYWKDKHTHIDVYGYYPYGNPESIDDYQFEVQKDQVRHQPKARWVVTKRAISSGERCPMWLLPPVSSVCLWLIACLMPVLP